MCPSSQPSPPVSPPRSGTEESLTSSHTTDRTVLDVKVGAPVDTGHGAVSRHVGDPGRVSSAVESQDRVDGSDPSFRPSPAPTLRPPSVPTGDPSRARRPTRHSR